MPDGFAKATVATSVLLSPNCWPENPRQDLVQLDLEWTSSIIALSGNHHRAG